jgi:hypothetical protein
MDSTLRDAVNDLYDMYYEDEQFMDSLDIYRESINKKPYPAIERLVGEMVLHDPNAFYMDPRIAVKNYLH